MRSAIAGLALLAVVVAAPASAGTITYEAFLNGSNEVPPNASPATGHALLQLLADFLTVDEILRGER